MQTAPYSPVGPLVQKDLRCTRFWRPDQGHQPPGLGGSFDFSGFYRIGQHITLFPGFAQGSDRAPPTFWFTGKANGGSQIHQALGIGHHASSQSGSGLQSRHRVLSCVPEFTPVDAARHILAASKYPGHHTLHISIKNQGLLTETESSDGSGSRRANARQLLQGGFTARKNAGISVSHHLCTPVQIACTAVIPQAAPLRQHGIFRSIGQIQHRRKHLQEPAVIGNDRGDLGLLQHDFRKPDAVGIARVLPGKPLAAMLALPADQSLGKRFKPDGHVPLAEKFLFPCPIRLCLIHATQTAHARASASES